MGGGLSFVGNFLPYGAIAKDPKVYHSHSWGPSSLLGWHNNGFLSITIPYEPPKSHSVECTVLGIILTAN